MRRAALLHAAALRHALALPQRLQHTTAVLSCCAPVAGSGARLQVLLRRGYRSSRPSASENSALLRELETALKDPDAIQRLSALLTPSTARNLSKALSNVQQQKGSFESTTVGAATTAAAQQEQSAAGAGVGAALATASSSQPATVSVQDLKYVALQYGLPFIGFGFVDNAIMILAGDYIDLTLGVSLGLSSMAAAGIGNTISDIAGLGLGNVVEDMCARLGLPVPALSQEQLMLKQTRWAKVIGSSIGVTIGCLLGMTPLLFLETREDHAKRAEEEQRNKNNSAIDIRTV